MTTSMTTDVEQIAGRACSWPRGCGNRVGLLPSAAAGGLLRCAWHDPGRRVENLDKVAERKRQARVVGPEDLPVDRIATMEDALALAKWVPIAIATGKIGGREAQAMVGALREFRMTAADAEFMRRFEALERRVAAAKAKGLDV